MSASPDLSRPRDSGAAIAIPSPTTLLEVRVGKLRPFGPVLSAIVKDARSDALFVSRLGFVDDEHDPTFHGGLEKAIHQYNADHYASWRKLFPAAETSERFVPGSFGENLVTRGWSEDNICAGDIVKVGYFDAQHPAGLAPSGCVLQVSLPRTPCFKLNQRFHLKNFAPRTHELNRTGWYYRVIQEGWVEPGMQMQITSRPNPAWSIKRLNHYVHREKENLYAITTLRALPHLGDECAEVFRDRWAKLQQKEKLAKETWRPFRLSLKQRQTPRITAFTFEALEPDATSTEADGGSHVSIKLPNGLKRAYSVISGTTDCFQLGVARDDNSRGGSAYMHDSLQVGDTITAGPVTASIQYNSMASHNILIAGGIGITAFPALIRDLTAVNITSELHYCVRSSEEVAFSDVLAARRDKVKIVTYDAARGERLDISRLLRERTWNSHVYVCGPQRMVEAVKLSATHHGMTDDEVHIETFKVETNGDPFTVDVASTNSKNVTVKVEAEQTLLDALRSTGFDTPSSCEAGNCATCKVTVRCGKVVHVGQALSDEEKETQMLSCVSRGVGHIAISLPEA